MPTGTVTLLLADVEGFERLWETQPEQMTAALARLDRAASEIVPAHDGVVAIEPGARDSFMAAFAHATDAVACAVELQRAPLSAIRLRVGVHTGEVRLSDAGDYGGPTPERAGRLRDLAHGGQILLSGITRDLVVDQVPDDTWLTDLGTHQLGDFPRPERVVQLCHSDLDAEFPPLRTTGSSVPHGLPVQLTRFVGRVTLTNDVVKALSENRLVTLAGPGGVGKTRLAVQVAAQAVAEFDGNVWFVDLTPLTGPEMVPVAAIRALGLPDQPGRSAVETLARFLGDRRALLVLDNCEHLIDVCAELTVSLLGGCPQLTILTASREPMGVAGELTWRVPSLSLTDEAIELFVDRARLSRPDFSIAVDDTAAVREICDRLDGLPLAIELAAARVRMMSLTEILDGLRNRFRLLPGVRAGVRGKKTLGGSVDWSHALLSEPERTLFRRLAVFRAGFDLDAARVIGDCDPAQQHEVLERLAQLVDKSLVLAENAGDRTRFRILETVRHFAMAKLRESGEADEVRTRHRDYYAAMAALLDSPADADSVKVNYEGRLTDGTVFDSSYMN